MEMHKVAAVLTLLSFAVSAGAQPAPAPAPACTSTVAQVASDAGLTTLLAAVQAAGLTSTLSDPGLAYTVFAPTNEAIAEALAELNLTAAALLNSPLLTPTLQNHLLGYPLTGADLVSYGSVKTQDNSAILNITATNLGNGTIVEVSTPLATANVIKADIPACKSIVHVIDAVLLPA